MNTHTVGGKISLVSPAARFFIMTNCYLHIFKGNISKLFYFSFFSFHNVLFPKQLKQFSYVDRLFNLDKSPSYSVTDNVSVFYYM